MVGLAGLQRGDPAAAEALYRWAVEAGDDHWSGHAAMLLAGLLRRRGDMAGAEAVLRRLVSTGNSAWACNAAFDLGDVLAGAGDAAEAKDAWQPLIDSADPELAGPAFVSIINLLRRQEDRGGLRAACQAAVAFGNPEALYALDQLGQLLHDQRDMDGAHAVWQEAIGAGYEHAEDLRERMMPESEKRARLRAYPDHLPPEFNPANMRRGIEVLEHGLPALPEPLSYHMAIPVAYWKAERCAVVLVLRYTRPWRSAPEPTQIMLVFAFAPDGSWTPRAMPAAPDSRATRSPGPAARMTARYLISGAARPVAMDAG